MLRFVILLAVSAILFVGGLGVSWFMLNKELQSAQPAASKEAAEHPAEKFPADPHAPPKEGTAEGDKMPISIRPDGKYSAEEIFRFGSSFRGQYEAIRRREAALREEKVRIAMVMEDVKGERRELDSLRAQAEDAIDTAEKLLARMQAEQGDLEAQKKASAAELETIKKSQFEYEVTESANLKKVSEWMQSMPAETAAKMLQTYVDEGKLQMAVKLLANIEERNVAKILAAIPAPSVVVQLTDAYRNLKPPTLEARK